MLYTYDKDLPFDATNIEQWFTALRQGKAKPVEAIGTANDLKIFDLWLTGSKQLNRTSFDDMLRDQDLDSVVFFYSSEHVSYQQRGYAYQFKLAIDKIRELEQSSVVEAIDFFVYDVFLYGYPIGISRGNALPHDVDGSMDGSFEVETAILP